MKAQEGPITDEPSPAAGTRLSRESWNTTLLTAAVLLYGIAAVLLMSMRVSNMVGLWLIGTMMGLVVLGLLIGNIPARTQLNSSSHIPNLPDAWAEEWEDLFQRAVR